MTSKSQPEMTLKQAKDTLIMAPMVIPVGIVFLAIHYFKPDFYWNDWWQKCLRKLLGETLADLSGYMAVFSFMASGLLFWCKAKEIVDAAANEPSSSEEETTISSESDDNNTTSNS